MTWRTIQTIVYSLSDDPDIPDPLEAIQTQAALDRYTYLLAHSDDGVIWGFWDGSQLLLSSDKFPAVSPPLRAETLWEARLFGDKAEWFLWREDSVWRGREIQDWQGNPGQCYDEDQLLWGTLVEVSQPPFTLLREGEQGIRHAPPKPFTAPRSLHLRVRHYLAEDASGAIYVRLSRLVDLV